MSMQGKIGIIGFGVVGKSVLKFFQNTEAKTAISVWDQKILDSDTQKNLIDHGIQTFNGASTPLDDFIKSHDIVIPSPGVNLNDFYAYKSKFVCELDIFNQYFKKPTIAITGSLGKTTTTKLLGQLTAQITPKSNASKKFKTFTGGNVGLGMLEAIEQQSDFDLGVLEISSFQLEFSSQFSPQIAVFTNCYPNHLDRHKIMQNYLASKLNLIRAQTQDQHAIFSEQFLTADVVSLLKTELQNIKSQIHFTCTQKPTYNIAEVLGVKNVNVFYKSGNALILQKFGSNLGQEIFDLSVLPEVTFIENWLQVIASLYLLSADMHDLHEHFTKQKDFAIDDHHHRVEHFATIRNVDFYDDSKATVIQSSLAATRRLAAKGPVILILGGLGKGVDRSPLCQDLATVSNLKKVYCYGPECKEFDAIACKFNKLEEIIADINQIMLPGDQVVLSPSGTSFDFYQNYKHRGQVFKDLVKSLIQE